RRALLRLDSMAAPDPHSLGVPRPQFPRLCPACLPRYSLQTILRRVLNKTEIETQQNSRAGVAFFPAVQPRAMPRRYGASYRRGGLKRRPLLVLEPSARTIRGRAATKKCLTKRNKPHRRGKAKKKQNRQ